MRISESLGAAGMALWESLMGDYEFTDGNDLALLELACKQADDVAALDDLLRDEGYMVPGSKGQQRLSMAVSEVRQGRLALGKLLAQLALPDEQDTAISPSSRQAQHAANVRWGRVRERRERLANGEA